MIGNFCLAQGFFELYYTVDRTPLNAKLYGTDWVPPYMTAFVLPRPSA